MSEREPLAGERPAEPDYGDPPLTPHSEAESPPEVEAASDADVVEVVDGYPVLAEVRTIEHVSPASLPAVQAAAAAAAGFVAGAATVALVRRRAARKSARSGRGAPRRAVDMLPIVGSRSFLVDVHVIGKQGD